MDSSTVVGIDGFIIVGLFLDEVIIFIKAAVNLHMVNKAECHSECNSYVGSRDAP